MSTPTIESLLEIIAAQAAQIARLETRIKELENRLNKNSKNSSNPPSTDGFKQPPTTSLREKGINKSGGQQHKQVTLYRNSFSVLKKMFYQSTNKHQSNIWMKQDLEWQQKHIGCMF